MTVILVDGSALIYRAFYAFAKRPLTSPSGEVTSVAFGFVNSILRLVEARRPTHLAIAFDLKGKTFRHDMYPLYKAQRKPMPEEMAEQLPRLRELIAAWGVPVFEKQGFEADDVLATMARLSAGVCDKAWFYTGDKDFQQCIDERIGMLKPGRRGDDVTEVDLEHVRREWGLDPAELVDVFALSGDASDNIPGAPGIGPKTATKLIQENGSLDELLANLDTAALTPRQKSILTENRDQILLSRRLFVIDDAVPMDIDWDSLRTVLPVSEKAVSLLEEMGLRRAENLARKVAKVLGREAPERLAGSAPGPSPEPSPEPSTGLAAQPAAESAPGPAAQSEDQSVAAAETDRTGSQIEPGTPDRSDRTYRILNDASELKSWLDEMPEDAPLAVDTETAGRDKPIEALRGDLARLVGVSLAWRPGEAVYVPVLRREGEADLFATAREIDALDAYRPLLAAVLADTRRMKIGHNLKYDEWILTRHGMPLAGPRFDTMVAAYVLDPGRASLKLDNLAADILGEPMVPFTALFPTGSRDKDILTVPLERLGDYAAEDADMTLRLHRAFAAELADLPQLERLFQDVEMPLQEVLFRMEQRGIKVDSAVLEGLRGRFESRLAELQVLIYEAAGGEFNVQSPKQLSEILFDRLGLKPTKKTATGWSTDESVLKDLSDKHPLPALMLEHRGLAKLLNTYVLALNGLINPDTGMIHTSYNQAVAATGRLSSSDPNLQNIPIRSPEGRLIRGAFVPRDPGNVFLSADYSQVELRLLAHLSGDESLRETFRRGGDIHRETAAQINGIDPAEVTPAMRSRAKAVNFGVLYGMGSAALAKQEKIPRREAQEFIDRYFRTYPRIKEFKDAAVDSARREGQVETVMGRRRRLPDIHSGNGRLRSNAERMAVNTPIQGAAADIIKVAMIVVDAELTARGLAARILLQVHDELLLEVPRDELETVAAIVKDGMEGAVELSVPLTVDIHTGADWAAAHD